MFLRKNNSIWGFVLFCLDLMLFCPFLGHQIGTKTEWFLVPKMAPFWGDGTLADLGFQNGRRIQVKKVEIVVINTFVRWSYCHSPWWSHAKWFLVLEDHIWLFDHQKLTIIWLLTIQRWSFCVYWPAKGADSMTNWPSKWFVFELIKYCSTLN